MQEIRKHFTVDRVKAIAFENGKPVECEIADDFTEEEKQLLEAIFKKQWDIDEYDTVKIRTFTSQQIEAYIDNNVKDLASAKEFLKVLSKAILFLYKRLERE